MARDDNVHSRYECKYLISPLLYDEIRSFMTPFMEPDRHAAHYPGYAYPISSLYLDSPDMKLYEQVAAGEKTRFKLRVRSYSDDPKGLVFFEVKRRMNQIVQKHRAAVDRQTARAILDREAVPRMPRGLAQRLMPDLDEFTRHRLLIGAKPALRVRYMREAYESKSGDPLRITFDTKLAHAVTLDSNLSVSVGDWRETPVDGVILEIKFTDNFPTWVEDMAEIFQLRQRSVPKYVMSVDVAGGSRSLALSLRGIAPPPRFEEARYE